MSIWSTLAEIGNEIKNSASQAFMGGGIIGRGAEYQNNPATTPPVSKPVANTQSMTFPVGAGMTKPQTLAAKTVVAKPPVQKPVNVGDVLKEVPGSIIPSLGIINKAVVAPILQAPGRALASGGINAAAQILSAIKKKPVPAEWTPTTKLEKMVFGETPIKGLFKSTDEAIAKSKEMLDKIGVKNNASTGIAVGFAPIFVAGITALDLSPFGGEKNLVKTLAGAKDVSFIAKTLRDLGVAEDLIMPYAEKFAATSSEKEIRRGLQALDDIAKNSVLDTAKATGVPPVSKVGEAVPPVVSPVAGVPPLTKANIGVTYYKDGPLSSIDETIPLFESPKGKTFESEIIKNSQNAGVKIPSVKRVAGLYEGNIEPSYSLKDIEGTREQILKFASQTGGETSIKISDKPQDSVLIFWPGEGTGTEYTFTGISDIKTALSEMDKAGIPGSTININGKDLIVYDADGGLKAGVNKLSQKINIKPTETYGEVQFLGEPEYSKYHTPTAETSKGNDYLPSTIPKTTTERPSSGFGTLPPIKVAEAAKPVATDAVKVVDDILAAGKKLIKEADRKTNASKLETFLANWYDKDIPVANLMKNIEDEIGRKLTMEENVYVATRTYAGLAGKISEKLTPFSDVLNANRDLIRDGHLSNYLFSERAIERAGRGFKNPGGLTAEQAQASIDQLKIHMGEPAFAKLQKAAADIKTYTDNLLKYTRDAGVISKEAYESILKNNQKYVPFDIIEHMAEREGAGSIVPAGGKSFSVAEQSIIKSIKGTEMLADDPLNAILRKTIKTVELAERNTITKKLANLRNVIGENADGFIVAVNKDETNIPKGWVKMSYLDDGVKKSIAVPKAVGEAMTGMTAKNIDFLTHGIAWWAKALRVGATSGNIAFAIPNMIRDMSTAFIVFKHGFGPVEWARGFWEALKPRLNSLGLNLDESLFKEYQKNAGQIGGYYNTYLREIPRTVSELTGIETTLLGNVKKFLMAGPKLVGEITSISEEATRLGVFGKALRKGETTLAAGFMSRNATVDFSKMGNSMKGFNSLVPFVNARLQGTINVVNAVAEAYKNPKTAVEMTAKLAFVAIGPFVASYTNNVKNWPDVWDNLSDYEKTNNIIWIYGNRQDEDGKYTDIIKIPKGEFNYFVDPVQDVMEYLRGKDPNLIKTLAENWLTDFLPVTSGIKGKYSALGYVASITPPPIKATVETMTNTNLYTGLPIVSSQIMQKASPKEQYKGSTSFIAKKFGDWFGWSPLKTENAIKTMFGGVGSQALGVAGTVAQPGPSPTPLTAIAKRFTGAAGKGADQKAGEEQGKYVEMSADKSVMETRAAQTAMSALLKATSKEEALLIFKDIASNPRIMDKIENLLKDKALNRTYTNYDQLIGLRTDVRAQFVYDKLNSFKDNTERREFLIDLTKKGVLTKDTMTELAKIIASKK